MVQMDNLFISQVASLEGPQTELDPTNKARNQNANQELSSQQVFVRTLDAALKEVNDLLRAEQEDLLSKDEEEDEDPEERE